MSIEAMNWALSQQTGSPAAKSVLLILANRADHKGVCWPGITGIASQTELSRRAVIDNLRRLEEAGFLRVTKRANPLTNLYRLAMEGSAGAALVQELHGAGDAPELVQELHLPSAGAAPKPSVTINKPSGESAEPDWASVTNLNLEAWKQWLEDRRRRRFPKYKTTREARRLATLPHEEQARCVDYSLDRYQGLFPEKFDAKAKRSDADSFDAIHARTRAKAGLG